jgi:hypothetical protein
MTNTTQTPTLYIVAYWLPFPSSEYGGVQIVIAESDAECERMIVEEVDGYHRTKYPHYPQSIANRVKEAKRFPVDTEQRGVVHRFLT